MGSMILAVVAILAGAVIRSAGPNRVWEDDDQPQSDDLYRSTLTGRQK